MNTKAPRYSAKLKFQVVLESFDPTKTPGQIAKVYRVHPNSVGLWKKIFLDRGPEIFACEGTVAEYERRISELEQLLARCDALESKLRGAQADRERLVQAVMAGIAAG